MPRGPHDPAMEGETLLSPFTPFKTNFSRRLSPPVAVWGRRPPRGGQDARLLRPGMGPGREQAPRRPHDAGRPRSGPCQHEKLSPAGPRRAALARGRWPILKRAWAARRGLAPGSGVVCPRQRLGDLRVSAAAGLREASHRFRS